MTTKWYCRIDDVAYGPMTVYDIQRMASSARLQPDDFVSNDNQHTWIAANNMASLAFPDADPTTTGVEPHTTESPLRGDGHPSFPIQATQPISLSAEDPNNHIDSDGTPQQGSHPANAVVEILAEVLSWFSNL